MKTLLTALFLLLGVQNGFAETVRVRSGEHDDFSRLVFSFAQPTGWVLKPAEVGYLVQFDRPELDFDLSQVFRFIPATRLSAIESGPTAGSVRLKIGCRCHVEIFELDAGRVVLDIKNGPESGQAGANALKNPLDPEKVSAPPAATAQQYERPASLRRPPVSVFGTFVELPADTVKPPSAERKDSGQDLDQMQADLLKKLSRAAAQGLVQIDVAQPPEPMLPATAHRPEPSAPPEAKTEGEDSREHLKAQTSVDRDTASLMPAPVTDQGEACVSADAVRVEEWGAGQDPRDMIGLGRVSLVGEFDAVKAADLRRLVRDYIYLGFGAEALAVLRAFEVTLDDAALLSMMAEVVDKGDVTDPQWLKSQLGCDAPIALWATLAFTTVPQNAEINLNAVQIAFSALPLHLRRSLGPGLADRFLAAGYAEAAASVRNAIARAPGTNGSESDLMQARADLEHGQTEKAVADLERIVARDDSIAPQALLDLFEVHHRAKTRMPARDVAMADSLAFELRETPFASELLRVSVLGSAMNEDFQAAFRKLARNGQPGHLQSELLGMLAETPDDGTFIEYVFATLPDMTAPYIPLEIRAAVAGRMRALGFSQEARSILDDAVRPGAAERKTAPEDHDADAPDRAEAAQQKAPAQQVFAQIGMERAEQPSSSDESASLATARTVLSESSRTRGLLSDLLADVLAD